MPRVPKCVRLARPGESLASFVEGEPLESLMLLAERRLRVLRDERGEGNAHLDGVGGVQVEAAHRHVVQCFGIEAGFLAKLADRRFLRLFACVDLTVDGFPRAGPLAIRGTLEREDAPVASVVSDHEELDDAGSDFCHYLIGHPLIDDGLWRIICRVIDAWIVTRDFRLNHPDQLLRAGISRK